MFHFETSVPFRQGFRAIQFHYEILSRTSAQQVLSMEYSAYEQRHFPSY